MFDSHSAPVIVTVCTTCRRDGAARHEADGLSLLEGVRSAAAGVAGVVVRPTQCLSVCKRVCCVSISGAGRYTFLFGDLLPAQDAAAVVAMAEACRDAPLGFVPWRDRPEALRKGIIARVPPPDWSPADGASPG